MLLGRYVRGLLRDVVLPRMDADPSHHPHRGHLQQLPGYLCRASSSGLLIAGVDLTAIAVVLGGFFGRHRLRHAAVG